MNELRKRGVECTSFRKNIDTTPGGKLMFHVFGTVAEFERELILERTMAGLEAARVRGGRGSRKPVMDRKKIALNLKPMRDRDTSLSERCAGLQTYRGPSYTVTWRPTASRQSGGGRAG